MNKHVGEQFDELTIKEVEECALRRFVRAFREREEEEEGDE